MRKSGMGFLSTLGLIFIILKLVDVITWSWWWVLAPFWVMPALLLAVFLFYVYACIATKDKIKWW